MFSWIVTAWSAVSGLFGGSSSKAILWLSIALCASILLGWLFWSRASLKADLAASLADVSALKTAYTASQSALSELQDALDRQNSALAEREHTINEISAQRDQWRKRWQEAQHDQAVRDWGAVRLPDAVRELLQ